MRTTKPKLPGQIDDEAAAAKAATDRAAVIAGLCAQMGFPEESAGLIVSTKTVTQAANYLAAKQVEKGQAPESKPAEAQEAHSSWDPIIAQTNAARGLTPRTN